MAATSARASAADSTSRATMMGLCVAFGVMASASYKVDGRARARQHAADAPRAGEFRGIAFGKRKEEAARRLGIVQQVLDFARHRAPWCDSAGGEFPIVRETGRNRSGARVFDGAGQELQLVDRDLERHAAGQRHFAR